MLIMPAPRATNTGAEILRPHRCIDCSLFGVGAELTISGHAHCRHEVRDSQILHFSTQRLRKNETTLVPGQGTKFSLRQAEIARASRSRFPLYRKRGITASCNGAKLGVVLPLADAKFDAAISIA